MSNFRVSCLSTEQKIHKVLAKILYAGVRVKRNFTVAERECIADVAVET